MVKRKRAGDNMASPDLNLKKLLAAMGDDRITRDEALRQGYFFPEQLAELKHLELYTARMKCASLWRRGIADRVKVAGRGGAYAYRMK